LDAHPVPGSILTAIAFSLLTFIIMIIAMMIMGIIIGDSSSEAMKGYVTRSSLIGAPFTILFYWLWFRPETNGLVKGGKLSNAARVIIVFLIYWVISLIMSVVAGASVSAPPVEGIWTSVFAGIIEELLTRGVLISPMMRKDQNKKTVLTALFVSAGVFGAVHLSNALVGADLGSSISQTFSSFCFGIIFATGFLLTGNVLPCMIIHALYDISVFAVSNRNELSDSGVVKHAFGLDNLIDDVLIGIAAVYIVYYIMQEPVQEKIKSVWKDKWHLQED
nr:CPBP family intramembrane metalloprotease [Lachnospiraceae bacterium]